MNYDPSKHSISLLFPQSGCQKPSEPNGKQANQNAGGNVQKGGQWVSGLKEGHILRGKSRKGGVPATKTRDEEKFQTRVCHCVSFKEAEQKPDKKTPQNIHDKRSPGKNGREIFVREHRCQVAEHTAEAAAEAYQK